MRNSTVAVRFALAVALLAMLVLPFVSGPMRVSADPEDEAELKIEPSSADSGSVIRVRGEDFAADEDGELILVENGDEITDFETDGDGAFNIQVTVPNIGSGEYKVRATVDGEKAEAKLTVTGSGGDDSDDGEDEPTQVPTEDDSDEDSDDDPTKEPDDEATSTPTSTNTPTEDKTPTTEPTSKPTGEIFVANNGSDNTGDGAENNPYRTLQKALDVAQAGNVISLTSGTYTASSTVQSKRGGKSGAPITIQSAPGDNAVISGPASSRGLQINHSWYVIKNLEFTKSDILLWLDGATNVVITGNSFHHAGGECVRIKNQSSNNTFSHNSVSNCGLEGFNLSSGSKNGEGIYLGTAPEQRSKIGGVPDYTLNNLIEYNTFATNGSEAVDIKEDAEGNVVRYNVGSGNRDADGANFGTRGDKNSFIGNESFNSAGAGFRAGGDTVSGRVYGKNNVFRENNSHDNAMHSFKFMVGPQTVDCSNVSARNGGQVYYFGTTTFDIFCQGTDNPDPTSTPGPISTPEPSKKFYRPTDDTQAASNYPTRKFGSSTTFRVDANPATVTYIKFVVTGVDSSRIGRVKLRLYVNDAGGSGLTLQQVGSKSWTEGGLNWNNRPSVKGTVYGTRTGSDKSGTWIEFNLTGVVVANGTYSMALWSTSSDGYSFNSAEASRNRPYLVVELE